MLAGCQYAVCRPPQPATRKQTKIEAPYFLITNGSTGSGKTVLVQCVIEHLELEKDNNKLLIDDLVEKNDSYKVDVLSIMQGVERHFNFVKDDVREAYIHPTEDLIKRFNNAYYTARSGVEGERGSIKNCNDLLDTRMEGAIRSRQNIVFETTGLNDNSWLFQNMLKDDQYYVISSYSLVNVPLLAGRMTQRTLCGIKDFEQDVRRSAPRLPDLNVETIARNQRKIIENLLRDICALKSRECGSRRGSQSTERQAAIDRILVYDNSSAGSPPSLIYDSDACEMTCDELQRRFVSYTKA